MIYMENIAIFIADSNGRFPVPATKDGAVPILVEHLLEKNNVNKKLNMTIITYYDKEAYKKSKCYDNIKFVWVKIPRVIKMIDKCIYLFVKNIMKKKKTISYKTIASLIYYIQYSSIYLKKRKFDKIILENNIPLAWIIKLSKYKGKYYYHFHNLPRIDANCRKVFERCDGYICVSEFVKNNIVSNKSCIGMIKENKVGVLYNCIDTIKFNNEGLTDTERNKFRQLYNIKKEEKVVIFVGRLSKEKGVDKVIEALAYVENVHLLIVGSVMHGTTDTDEYQKYLYNLVEKNKKNITFTGYISQNVVNKLYKFSDIAILPSVWDEPAGLTMIEAMACGIPLITCRSGGIPEYVGDYATLLNKDNSVTRQIVDSLNYAFSHMDEAKVIGEKGSKYVIDRYNLDAYYSNFVELLSKM